MTATPRAPPTPAAEKGASLWKVRKGPRYTLHRPAIHYADPTHFQLPCAVPSAAAKADLRFPPAILRVSATPRRRLGAVCAAVRPLCAAKPGHHTQYRRGPDALSGKAVLRCNWRMAASEVAPAGGPPGLGAAEALGAGGGGRGGVLLSAAEREFVTKSVEQGVRPDGRERLASRSIHLETGVIPGAFGSAQAQCGGTKVGPLSGGSRAGMRTASCACLRAHAVPIHVQVVAAVKAELVSPAPPPAAPGGRIEVSVTCSLTASPLFEGARGEAVSVILFALLPHAFGCCA